MGTNEIPATVRDAVLARAARVSALRDGCCWRRSPSLSPAAQMGLLEAIAGDAMVALRECIGAGVVISAGRGVAFRHELARLVLEESMAPDRRVALHARALRAMADSPDRARLAHHAEAAGDAGAVLRLAPDAARRASALGAHRESAELIRAGAALLRDAHTRGAGRTARAPSVRMHADRSDRRGG